MGGAETVLGKCSSEHNDSAMRSQMKLAIGCTLMQSVSPLCLLDVGSIMAV